MNNNPTKKVTICGVPHEMSIVDGGVMFSDKSGFWGLSSRIMFEYRSGLWYILSADSTFNKTAACHIVRMYEMLAKHIGGNHEVEELRWKQTAEQP